MTWMKALVAVSGLATVLLTIFAYGWLAVPCSADPSCKQDVPLAYHQRYHALAAVGLGVVLLREGSLLLVSWADSLLSKPRTWRLLDEGLPQLLLCTVLCSLTCVEVHLAMTPLSWIHVGQGRPIYTVRYASWLVDAPVLMVLTCCGALQRPFSEAVGPFLATGGYILVSWAVLFLENANLRWLLIAGTFVAYFWASERMMQWVVDFLKEENDELPCRGARIASVLLVIIVFGLYGAVYLAGAGDLIGFSTEMLGYTVLGFFAKVSLSVLFASIRSYQNHQALARLVTKVRGTSVAFVSLLRGSFDHVVPCTVSANGTCKLSEKSSRDIVELEHLLGRPMASASFNRQLVGSRERERFATYVQNALRQHLDTVGADSKAKEADAPLMPPVAQALHVRLRKTLAESEDTSPNSVNEESLRVMVHLSMAPQEEYKEGPKQAVLALQILSQEETSWAAKTIMSDEKVTEGPEEEEDRSALQIQESEPCVDEISVEGQVGNGVRLSSSGTMYSTKKSTAVTTSSGNDAVLETEARMKRSGKKISRRRNARAAKLLVRALNRRIRPKRSQCSRTSAKVRDCRSKGKEDIFGDAISDTTSCQKVSFVCGGSDVCSQSSRLSGVNSVVMACRQLLGPLHDELPPAQYISKRIEDHVTCSAEMVKLKACSEITRHCYNQRLAEWTERADTYRTSVMLDKGSPPHDMIPEQIWRNEVLMHLQASPPGPRPRKPNMPEEEDLWHKAWKRTYESDSESEVEGL
mmetsp:Transcript_9386/g.22537  ORF Transcript_9386/g.22537 Transcript_9386/m.22537 type:complete len:752 (-) Transcript_9386:119-2374(-)